METQQSFSLIDLANAAVQRIAEYNNECSKRKIDDASNGPDPKKLCIEVVSNISRNEITLSSESSLFNLTEDIKLNKQEYNMVLIYKYTTNSQKTSNEHVEDIFEKIGTYYSKKHHYAFQLNDKMYFIYIKKWINTQYEHKLYCVYKKDSFGPIKFKQIIETKGDERTKDFDHNKLIIKYEKDEKTHYICIKKSYALEFLQINNGWIARYTPKGKNISTAEYVINSAGILIRQNFIDTEKKGTHIEAYIDHMFRNIAKIK